MMFCRPPILCCATMAEAFATGTDNDAYGPLLRQGANGVIAGFSLPAWRWCPWCGKEVGPPPRDKPQLTIHKGATDGQIH